MTVNENTITWKGLDLSEGRTFTTRLKADISNTVTRDADDNITGINDNDADNTAITIDVSGDGIYPFATTIDTPGDRQRMATRIALETDAANDAYKDARLYAVLGNNESVKFELVNPASDASAPPNACLYWGD